MGRPQPNNRILNAIRNQTPIRPKIYTEGTHDNDYLEGLAKQKVITPFTQGTKLPASAVKLRIEAIEKDLNNEAIEYIIWIVDGGDQHIKKSSHFIKFYKKWKDRKINPLQKLYILLNTPCLEYWFLLHRTDAPLNNKNNTALYFQDASALFNSKEFKKICPEGKGNNLVEANITNKAERNKAIARATDLYNQIDPLIHRSNDDKFLCLARAEIYQIFELIKVNHPSYS